MAANNGEVSQFPPLQVDPDRTQILGRIRNILAKIYDWSQSFQIRWRGSESVQVGSENETIEQKNVIRLHQVWPGKNVLINLIVARTSDPGIIQRREQQAVEEVESSDGIRSKGIVINGVEVKQKHRKICKHFRRPGSCHCAVCDNCVERFDHHCPWISQCIGLVSNDGIYRYYLLFISSGLVLFIYFFSFSCERKKMRMSSMGAGLLGTAVNIPQKQQLALFSMAAIVFLGGLTLYYAYLVMLNQTAYENYKRGNKDSSNPYDKGILSNIKEALFTKIPSSRRLSSRMPGWCSKSTDADGIPAGKRFSLSSYIMKLANCCVYTSI